MNTAASQANQSTDQGNSEVAQAFQLASQVNHQAGRLDGRVGGCGPLTINPQPPSVPRFHT